MKNVFLVLLVALLSFSNNAQEDSGPKKVYQFEIKQEIGAPIWRTTKMAMEEAHEIGADLIFINMNTYGGAVDAADSIRTKILQSKIPVYVLIQNNAASAGALISIACDSIFMQPGSTIGAATVVDQSGEPVPDKYQSYMRKKMRATAEENGRDPDIAEGMVDPDKEIEGLSEKGKVITLTVTEAIEYGFCDGEFQSMAEVLTHSGFGEYEVVKQRLNTTDKIIGWLINPAISGVLILVIFGGIYFELQSPGLGFPIVAALAAATLYFAPLYLEGLAENWEILLFISGLILIAIELFVIPGFGVAGIAGIALTVTALSLAMVGNVGFDFSPVDTSVLVRSFLISAIASSVSVAGSILLAVKLFQTNAFSTLVLNAVQNKAEGYTSASSENAALIGSEGVAYTDMMPSGKVEVNDRVYDAASETGFIEKGQKVKVTDYTGSNLKVRLL
ncbi:MAG TPA: serine protease [Flavobacteriales bacterium]|nr:serine protease [Flavobacteriales bacterium]